MDFIENAIASVVNDPSLCETRFAWHETAVRVRSTSKRVCRHLSDQHAIQPASQVPEGDPLALDLYVLTDEQLLKDLKAAVKTPWKDRESFKGDYYRDHTLPDGGRCLIADERQEYPHALLTRDHRTWILIGDSEQSASLQATRTVREFVRERLLDQGALMFHGSAVELPDGRGVFFCGAKGAGKTSAALRLSLGGGRIVGTDRTFLLRSQGEWIAVGLPSSTRVADGTAASLGILDVLRAEETLKAAKFSLSNERITRLLGSGFTPAVKVDLICSLRAEPVDRVRIRTLETDRATSSLQEHLLDPDPDYRSCWVDPALGNSARDTSSLAALAEGLTVHEVTWNPERHCDDKLTSLLTATDRNPGGATL